ncbi:hypothetical protein LEP1GSC077_2637 [Leptospira interrogans str. C10069]|nr:hypothetical protein LEP1GSC077_2637 [Leptospira interrogans str. C10069]
MQKVCFSDRENLSTSSPTQKQGKLSTTLFMNRVGNSAQRSL